MKKILVMLFCVISIVCCSIGVKADVDCVLTMEEGASIRTTGNQGIRFTAHTNVLPVGSTHGFFLVLGEVSKSDLVSAITNSQGKIKEHKIVDKAVDGSDLSFSVVIYNISNEYYEQDITALAYVKLSNGTYVYPTISVTRDIMTVAKKSYESGNNNNFISEIFHSKYVNTKYNLGYGYSSIEELESYLLDDFNAYASTSYNLGDLKDAAANQTARNNFAQFIGNSEYSKKWYWFFDYIANLRYERKEEIEAFATSNYDYYIENQNINYYTPCMKAIVEDYLNASGMTGYDTSKRLWILEFVAFFGRDGYSYYNAHTFDWAQEVYNSIYTDILDESNNCYSETTGKNVAITYEPVRDGFVFNGWFKANENSYIEEVTNTNVNSENLYAAWTKANTYYVDSSLNGSILYPRFNNLMFAYNTTAFNSIDKAIAKCTSGGTIYVASGTYGTNLTIGYNNITLLGNNHGISGNAIRNSESNITGTITIASGISNLIIDGFKFTGSSKIINSKAAAGTANDPSTNLNGFSFNNNYVSVSVASGESDDNLNGFICFKESENSYSHDLVFDNNYFEATNKTATNNALVLLDNFYNLIFTNNKLINAPATAFRVDDTSKGASGKYVIITNNEIINAKRNGIDIDWVSPLEDNAYIDISNNILTNTGNLGIYLGKFNNADSYDYININNNVLNGFANGILVMRSIVNAPVSVSFNEFYGTPATYYIKLDNGGASVAKAVDAFENLYYDNNGIIEQNYEDYFVGDINSTTLFYITHTGNGTIKLNEQYDLSTNIATGVTWESSNPLIASVLNGVVTGVGSGTAVITATSPTGTTATIGLTIYDPSSVSDLLKLLIENNIGTIWNEDITYIGYQGNKVNNINGSANNYYPGSIPNVTNKLLSNSAKNYSGVSITNLLYITIHDTGSSAASANANANGNWCVSADNQSSSWHYTIGNDGIYHHVPDNVVAWHAGDGRTTATLQNTGIAVTRSLRYRPTITMGNDGYFYLDGVKTNVKYPNTATPATGMNTLGIGVVVKNGYYYIPTTRITSQYGKVVAINGGNMQSIGIETCVNSGSDVYLTWQYTAKFVATLLVNNDLGPDRVMFHNNFSNKTCPNTMINAGKVDNFLDMCYVEYMIRKYYNDYSISFTSLNPTFLNNNGRVVSNPSVPTSVGYTITIRLNDVVVDTVTLYSTVSPKQD